MITQSPGAIANSAIVQICTDVYTIGGWLPNSPIKEVYKYSLSTDTCVEVASLPVGIYHAYAAIINDKIYLFGGQSTSFVNTVYVYTPERPATPDPGPNPEPKPEPKPEPVGGKCCCGSMKFELTLPVSNNVEALRELNKLVSTLNSCNNSDCCK